MAIVLRVVTFVLLLSAGAGLGFGALSLLSALNGGGSPKSPAMMAPAGGETATARPDAGASPSADSQAPAGPKATAADAVPVPVPASAPEPLPSPTPSDGQGSPIFQAFAAEFGGKFASVDCDKNPHLENGTEFGADYLLHFAKGAIARYVTGGYHHISADSLEFAIDDENSELYTIDQKTIWLSGIKINNVVIQEPPVDPVTRSTTKMNACPERAHGKPEETPPSAPYSDTDGLRLALRASDGEAAIGFLSHGASLPPRELDEALAKSTVPEAQRNNIKEQNRTNASAPAAGKQ